MEREGRRAVGGPSAMRDELVAALARMEALLRECGWNEQADWLSARRNEFASLSPDSPSFHQKLRDLDAILAGMGSLSDVPMYPKEGSALTVLQARQQHWDLIALIDSLVSGLRRRAARRKGGAG